MAVGGLLAEDGRAQSEGLAYSFEPEGEIDRQARRAFERALEDAESKGARLVIVRLDTPGGESETTREMVRALLAAPFPVVVYVAPDGARAGSAGVFLTLAADVAAMAPQTNIGSASTILVGPLGPPRCLRLCVARSKMTPWPTSGRSPRATTETRIWPSGWCARRPT